MLLRWRRQKLVHREVVGVQRRIESVTNATVVDIYFHGGGYKTIACGEDVETFLNDVTHIENDLLDGKEKCEI